MRIPNENARFHPTFYTFSLAGSIIIIYCNGFSRGENAARPRPSGNLTFVMSRTSKASWNLRRSIDAIKITCFPQLIPDRKFALREHARDDKCKCKSARAHAIQLLRESRIDLSPGSRYRIPACGNEKFFRGRGERKRKKKEKFDKV